MLIYYGIYGLFANISLIMNMIFLISVLTILQATLTLPGIAGIVLTIGMAVDANVLIFERIREENLLRENILESVDQGFKRAVSTIVDANLTNVIGKNMGKISAWYDNEWGFSNRMCDIAQYLHKIS